MSHINYFGYTIMGNDGPASTYHLRGKTVGVLIGSIESVDCQEFFTKLLAAYHRIRETIDSNFEVVYVSTDEDRELFDQFYGLMPWFGVPYDEEHMPNIQCLFELVKVRGDYQFVMLDVSEEISNPCATEEFLEDENNYPWPPKSLDELMALTLQDKNGSVPFSSLDGKRIAFYFTDPTNPNCVDFDPAMTDVCTQLRTQNRPFEVILCTKEPVEKNHDNKVKALNCKTIGFQSPYYDRVRRAVDADYLPQVLIMDENRETVSPNACELIKDNGMAAYPWDQSLCVDINVDGTKLGKRVAVMVLLDNEGDAEWEQFKRTFVKELYLKSNQAFMSGERRVPYYYYCTKTSFTVGKIHEGTHTVAPNMIITDLGNYRSFWIPNNNEISLSNIDTFIDEYSRGLCTRGVLE